MLQRSSCMMHLSGRDELCSTILRFTNYVQQKSFTTRNSREEYDERVNKVDNLIININRNLLINNININNLINIPANPSPQSNTLASSIPQTQPISERFDEDSAQVKVSYNLDDGNWVNYFWTHLDYIHIHYLIILHVVCDLLMFGGEKVIFALRVE
eukprot:149777_1